jgi:hypothetical protein
MKAARAKAVLDRVPGEAELQELSPCDNSVLLSDQRPSFSRRLQLFTGHNR